MKDKKKSFEDATFVLLNQSPLTYTLSVGRTPNLIVVDDEGENRSIRHCPNERTIYADKQSKLALIKDIIFVRGVYNVRGNAIITQQFLRAHPQRGRVFQLVDNKAAAEDNTQTEELILDIKMDIRKRAKSANGVEMLRAVAGALRNDVEAAAKMSVHELKDALYDEIDTNHLRFVNDDEEITIFDDPKIIQNVVSQQAFKSGVVTISADGSRVVWGDNKATICHIPMGIEHTEALASFLGTKEGAMVTRQLQERS